MHRQLCARFARTRRPVRRAHIFGVEKLEHRTLLATTTLPATFGSGPNQWDSLVYHQSFQPTAPVDTFLMDLRAGDVLNVTADRTSGAPPEELLLRNASGTVLMHTVDTIPALPKRSPVLPGLDVGLAYVVTTAGTYQVESRTRGGSSGQYDIRFQVFRPALEQQPVGTRQILFVDFDGARLNPFAMFGDGFDQTISISPLEDYLDDFGMVSEDASVARRQQVAEQFIDKIMATVRENLYLDIAQRGVNRVRPGRGSQGAFDLTIVDSRDGTDVWGQAHVSRVIVGGGSSETGFIYDVAESVDVGNMVTRETALVQLETKTHLINSELALPINPDVPNQNAVELDLIATYLGNVISHEAGHLFGLFHSEDGNDRVTLTDVAFSRFLGKDGQFGTSDDLDLDFGVDDFQVRNNEFFSTFTRGGYAPSLDWLSFTLATGTVVRGDANGDGNVNAKDVNVIGLHWHQAVLPNKDGDLNGDGLVNVRDLNELGLSWSSRRP